MAQPKPVEVPQPGKTKRKRRFWKLHGHKLASAVGALIVLGAFAVKQFRLDPITEARQELATASQFHDVQELLFNAARNKAGEDELHEKVAGLPYKEQKAKFVAYTKNNSYLTVYEMGVSNVAERSLLRPNADLYNERAALQACLDKQNNDLDYYEHQPLTASDLPEPQVVTGLRKTSVALIERAHTLNLHTVAELEKQVKQADSKVKRYTTWEVVLFISGWFLAFVTKLFGDDTSLEGLPEK